MEPKIELTVEEAYIVTWWGVLLSATLNKDMIQEEEILGLKLMDFCETNGKPLI